MVASAGTLTGDMPILRRAEWQREAKRNPRLVEVHTMPQALFMGEPQERQAMANHGQTLARLAERGGLSPQEALAVLAGVRPEFYGKLSDEAAHRLLYAFTWAHNRGKRIAEQEASGAAPRHQIPPPRAADAPPPPRPLR